MNSIGIADSRWIDEFRSQGFNAASVIGSGMEGVVYSLVPGELVAKVWRNTTERHLEFLQRFYEALKAYAGAIATPVIQKIGQLHDAFVTVETFLPGQPLQTYLPTEPSQPSAAAVAAHIEVLKFLRTVHSCVAFFDMPVLSETTSLWKGCSRWSDAVRALLSSRLNRFGTSLRSSIPDLDRMVEGVINFLQSRDNVQLGLVHGDICGTNLMVDTSMRPLALFDFGFLSTVGDPAFDASIAAAVYDMYGPHAPSIDQQITEIVAQEMGYTTDVLLAYRAVYSLLTSHAYSGHETEGHFNWCVSMLRRQDVRKALLL